MSSELQTDDPTTGETWSVPQTTGQPAVPPMEPPVLDDETWEEAAPPRALRLRLVTAGLLTLGLLAGGFWIGAVVQRHDGTSSTTAATGRGAFARLGGEGASAFAGFGGEGGAGGAGATEAGVTRGTVIAVSGSTVDVSDTAGNVVKVTIGPSTTVSRTAVGAPGNLTVGDTVTVRGTTGAGGVVTASSITATAQGVASTAGGGFGGGGFGGGAGGFGGGAAAG
jgi:hypothetical protein